jgi:PPOX class probable F420-dependent enzyme
MLVQDELKALTVNAPTLDDLPAWAKDMLREARVGHLGLIDDHDRPRVLPVTFAFFEGSLWSAVDQKPKRVPPVRLARIRYLRRRPEAALTVHVYDEDWSKLAWVQAIGRVEIAELEDHPAVQDVLRTKYEPYRESPPPGPLLHLVCERALYWRARD